MRTIYDTKYAELIKVTLLLVRAVNQTIWVIRASNLDTKSSHEGLCVDKNLEIQPMVIKNMRRRKMYPVCIAEIIKG